MLESPPSRRRRAIGACPSSSGATSRRSARTH